MERSAVLRHTAHDLRGLASHYYSIETEDILACVDKGCLRSSGALGELAVSALSPRPCRVINYLQLLMDSADVIEVYCCKTYSYLSEYVLQTCIRKL